MTSVKVFIILIALIDGVTNSALQTAIEIANQLRICVPSDYLLYLPQTSVIDERGGVLEMQPHIEFSFLSLSDFYNHNGTNSTNLGRKSFPSCIILDFYDMEFATLLDTLKTVMEKASLLFKRLKLGERKPTIMILTSTIIPAIELPNFLSRNSSFPVDSNVFFTWIDRDYNSFSIWETFSIKRLNVFKKVLDGKVETLSRMSTIKSPAGRRDSFYGEKFISIIRPDQPDWMKYIGKASNITLIDGFSVHLYWNFQMMLNFSLGAVFGDSLKTLPNNTLGGSTVDQLREETADISLSMSSVVPFRATHLTFLQPMYHGIINCFFQQPAANSIRNIVTAPFDTLVWISLIATWVILIIVVKIGASLQKCFMTPRQIIPDFKALEKVVGQEKASKTSFETEYLRWEKYGVKRSTDKTITQQDTSDFGQSENDAQFAEEIGMWAFTANCQKSSHIIPDSFPMKMMFITGVFCGVVSFVGYSGAITSTLTVQVVPIKEFVDLTRFNFHFTVHERSEPFQNFLQQMIETEKLKQKVLKVSTQEEISHLLNPKQPRAFLTYSDLFYPTALELNYTETFICSKLSKVQVSSVLYKSGMFLKKGSEYAEVLNHKIIMMKERGFNDRFIRRYETNAIFPCGGEGGGTVDPIALTDVVTVILLVLAGLITSVFLLVLEVIHKKLRVKK